MTAPETESPERATVELREVEGFLYREARFADEHDYDAWEALWTDDAIYWVPANGDEVDPSTQVSVVHDNRSRIRTRLAQLRTGKRHSQSPKSRLRRLLSNVELLGTDGGDTVVGANFVVYEARERGVTSWAGRVTYRLRRDEVGELRMAYKKVELVDNEFALPSMSFLI
ncbi:aromatic-ring-hydroxylating dioxygenase subunit beta [Nitriliruptor alkaliphilus]|uniref:aromatic-ring-hydroxylating dioxygenase subunit beta n=1 Tax=Nitriliruptor alkaliphilus TaxID=427918 RepID=UPI00069624E1|nr:aromatic-ring-hydroxylating dioxygenase subunit beta [Nitriliruptor alkaliphilus]